MQHSGTKRKQVEQANADADSCSYASSAACSAMTPCKTDQGQQYDECCKPSATEACSPFLDVAKQQDQINQGLKYLEDILRVDTYQKPSYHRGTSIPVDGWIQPCNGCRSWTASSITINAQSELPLCKRCLIQIINLQRAQAQQRMDSAVYEPASASVPVAAVDDNNVHAYHQPTAPVPHPDYTVPQSGGKLRRWSEAGMDCQGSSSQESHSSIACTQSTGCTLRPGCTSRDGNAMHHSSQSYDSTKQPMGHVGYGCKLKRRAVCATP